MNYQKIYAALIDRAVGRSIDGYFEKHHVVPKCLGGGNEKSNIVKLTAEEHFVAHQLLVKMNPNHRGLALAVIRMTGGGGIGNKAYGWLRRRLAATTRSWRVGQTHSEETKKKMGAWQVGRTLSEETKKKISATKTGAPQKERKPHSIEARAKMSAAKKGKKMTEEQRRIRSESWMPSSTPKETAMKISAALRGRPKSAEHRAKLSAARTGQKSSPETKAKIKAGLAASTKRIGRPPRNVTDLLTFGTVTA